MSQRWGTKCFSVCYSFTAHTCYWKCRGMEGQDRLSSRLQSLSQPWVQWRHNNDLTAMVPGHLCSPLTFCGHRSWPAMCCWQQGSLLAWFQLPAARLHNTTVQLPPGSFPARIHVLFVFHVCHFCACQLHNLQYTSHQCLPFCMGLLCHRCRSAHTSGLHSWTSVTSDALCRAM